MFTEVQIENYKSIQSLKINLGRVNVFIGENGCGKSNILEAIALASAAAANKLDNEFLAPRGIRVTEPEFMRSAFDKENVTKEIKITLERVDQNLLIFVMQHDNKPYSNWTSVRTFNQASQLVDSLKEQTDEQVLGYINKYLEKLVVTLVQEGKVIPKDPPVFNLQMVLNAISNNVIQTNLEITNFLIYSPENSSLRTFIEEGQIQPLGTKGEGLLKLLRVLSNPPEKINEIKQRLELIDWFDDFKIYQNSEIERNIQIKDRYLDKELPYFNQRSSNEGFLFLMFYFALFVSDDTPKFFAIDNIENALNPKLCTRLIQELVELAKKYDKQVIFTTHNPAVLDGLDLHDDEQRLFTIYRNIYGHTKAERIFPPEPLDDDDPVPLSEAFLNGYIGGLPNNF
ncbi:MAG: chromosome segregation protein SMC [Pseudanabaena frigida]|uniref:Chromosome segregation protein SMC n=1 Tax=Pseudanabaena frigida TaxID=945775 RepID=A0A2W4XHY7_9CYAN|nr:MAG: chromosome segregation protein SMC [Pseudanabaena frigida]